MIQNELVFPEPDVFEAYLDLSGLTPRQIAADLGLDLRHLYGWLVDRAMAVPHEGDTYVGCWLERQFVTDSGFRIAAPQFATYAKLFVQYVREHHGP